MAELDGEILEVHVRQVPARLECSECAVGTVAPGCSEGHRESGSLCSGRDSVGVSRPVSPSGEYGV
ncbi:MAG: hypothetical protein GY703_03600 [Gammaproteobacteria bacterium]|nr:hypothetical protein [Gammaproteobacteria bacterium]